ncbi:MAG: NTP transferase domain-containing protein [Sodalis sp. (in: enterobacteria)]
MINISWKSNMLNIVVLMAGRGSRFSSAGYLDSKPFIALNNKRMIDLVVNNLTPTQPHRFIFICQREHLKRYNYEKMLKKCAELYRYWY